MDIFHTDLDNTLIYSYKADIGPDKRAVEKYQGREISFITEKTYRSLLKLRQRLLIVPTTTRTAEQYRRIDLGIGKPRYALVCNGGILLKDGGEVPGWYEESLRLISGARDTLSAAMAVLERDRRRNFELRLIRELFVFTKCDEPAEVAGDLKACLGTAQVEVFHHGAKVYVLPKVLNKGMAVKRFSEYIQADRVIAAGDSALDISMLNAAGLGVAPMELKDEKKLLERTVFMKEGIFSDQLLEWLLSKYF